MFLYSTVSTLKPLRHRCQSKARLIRLETGGWEYSASSVGEAGRLTDGGDSGDDFAELELVQNCGLSSSVQTHHENSHLLLGEV